MSRQTVCRAKNDAAACEAALVVQTVNPNGATEPNQTSYFLKYNAAATDPTVLLGKVRRVADHMA
ncbi:MAG: hypothetical protein ACLP19_28700 [Xanthobacteraceae bacterium]